jgi:hypothetical protein
VKKTWLPDNHEKLADFMGFYIPNKVLFGMATPDDEQWEKSIKELVEKLNRFLPTMRIVNDWRHNTGVSRYVLLQNNMVDLILGEDDNYAPIFLIIPESCGDITKAKREFKTVLESLKGYLVRKYSNEVYGRKNTWNLEAITSERRKHA